MIFDVLEGLDPNWNVLGVSLKAGLPGAIQNRNVSVSIQNPKSKIQNGDGGGVWGSNPPEHALAYSLTVLKTAPVTGRDAPPQEEMSKRKREMSKKIVPSPVASHQPGDRDDKKARQPDPDKLAQDHHQASLAEEPDTDRRYLDRSPRGKESFVGKRCE